MDQTPTLHPPPESTELMGTPRGKVGMWLFLVSDALTFGCLLAAYGAMRLGSADWPVPAQILDIPLTAFNTFVLICSSVTMVLAVSAVRHRDQKKLERNLLGTIVGGMIFLSIQAYEWTHLIKHEGLSLRKDLFSATFFSITGFHALHVPCGVLHLIVMLVKARADEFKPPH